MKFLRKIKGSALVEKIMIVAFSLAAGGFVITYLVSQINEAKDAGDKVSGI